MTKDEVNKVVQYTKEYYKYSFSSYQFNRHR